MSSSAGRPKTLNNGFKLAYDDKDDNEYSHGRMTKTCLGLMRGSEDKKLQILVLNPMSFQAELHLGHTILSCLGMSYVFEVIFSTFRSFSLSAHACGFR